MPWDISDAEKKDQVLTHAVVDMTPAMAKAEEIVRRAIDRRFEEQGNGEQPWAPLAPSTIADRARKGFGPTPILQRTGDLRGSMKGSHDRDSAEIGPSEDVAHAGFLADGTSRMPARDFLQITEAEAEAIEAEILAHLEAAE